ncbi:MAG: MarR family transcriptional regulator [Gammaproteobacteria bacterium]
MDQIDAVLIALRKVIRATDLHSKYLAKNTGLTTAQLLILQSIQNMGEVSIGEISKKISLSQATVTSILDRLVDKGLVYRERSSEDKRKVHAYLTEDAVALIKDAPAPLQEQFTKQFGALNEWEQSMMISSLQRIAQMMDAEGIDASPVLDVGILDRKNPN